VSKFNELDSLSAMDKLEKAAFKWDQTNYIEATYVNGFEAYLTPYDFKLQIERSFGVRLTGAEVSCPFFHNNEKSLVASTKLIAIFHLLTARFYHQEVLDEVG